MASAEESSSPEELMKREAKRLLKFFQNPEIESQIEYLKADKPLLDKEAGFFEQLRIQSDQFASIYPLLEGMDPEDKSLLLFLLSHCAESSVSANLLAKEKRLWVFLVASFEDAPRVIDIQKDGSKICDQFEHLCCIIQYLIPYVSKRTWKFIVQCGLLEHLLAGMQKKPRTCNSLAILDTIIVVLRRPITQGSIDTLVSGGLFRLSERLIQKSGHLLKGTPPCTQCNRTINKDINLFSDRLLMVIKINLINLVTCPFVLVFVLFVHVFVFVCVSINSIFVNI